MAIRTFTMAMVGLMLVGCSKGVKESFNANPTLTLFLGFTFGVVISISLYPGRDESDDEKTITWARFVSILLGTLMMLFYLIRELVTY